jgi:hypothetical protein
MHSAYCYATKVMHRHEEDFRRKCILGTAWRTGCNRGSWSIRWYMLTDVGKLRWVWCK